MELSGRLVIALLVVGFFVPAHAGPDTPTALPDPSWHRLFGEQQRTLAAARSKLLLVGDSLIQFWPASGEGSWLLEFRDLNPVNFGIAADRTEHILYRVRSARLEKDPPGAIAVLAGTNNLGKDPPDAPGEVADGVIEIAHTLARKAPDSRLFVVSILPSGFDPDAPLRAAIRATNTALRDGADANGYQFLDVHDAFLDGSGRWKPGLTVDGTHLTSRGYDILGGAIGKAVRAP